MNKNLLLKMKDYLNNQKNKSKRNKIFIGLAMVVFAVTIYILMVPGITMEEVLICFDEEHEHTSECYGTDSDMEDITNLTNMIEELPTVEEMNSHINELSTEEEKIEYRDEIIATATTLYSKYLDLEVKGKAKISNIDKLLEYDEQGLIEVVKDTSNNVDTFNNTGSSTFILKDNSNKLDTVETADTSKFVQINLYDYFVTKNDATNINYKFLEVDGKYPGFFQSYGPNTTTITNNNLVGGYFNFSDMITVDRVGGIRDSDYKSRYLNTINEPMPSTQQALSGYIKNILGSDGYPAIANGNLSLKYLFSNEKESYAVKQNVDDNGNTVNINGLFQYDEKTGRYHFDSRNNFAQFDSSTDTFTIYKQKITPNFMQYPFGNFLPLNNIKTETTQASTINKKHFDDVIASAENKASTAGEMKVHYTNVAERMSE